VIAERFREQFRADPQVLASAPGRVNLIGEHTDYNDGFVLPMAIDRRIHVALSSRSDSDINVVAEAFPARSGSYERYVEAVVAELRGTHALPGANLLIAGDVPIAAGLASSSALELAVARGLCELAGISWDPLTMARLAQRAENERVGVQCGIMDQISASCSRRGSAMLLDCRSLDLAYVDLADEVAIVVMDTGTRRGLGETAYNDRRAACERVVNVIRRVAPDVRALRDVSASLLKEAASLLEPVDLARASHVVHENQRPGALVQALSAFDYRAAGDVMNQSHASLRDLYDVSSLHLDIICEAARAHPACYGARMTGAGFGGCAIALVRSADSSSFISQVQPQYESHSYKRSDFFVVSPDEGARLEPRVRQNR